MRERLTRIQRHLLNWTAYLAIRLVVCFVQAVRMETCERLAELLAWFTQQKLRYREAIIDENLSHAFPHWTPRQRRRVARQMWRHFFLLICELAHAPRKIHRTNWRDYVDTKHMAAEVEHLLSDRPVVVVSGHFGNFEVGGVISALLGYPTYTVARSLDNPLLDRFMKRFRESSGQFILPKRGSSFQVDAILNRGGTLMLLGDQAAGPKGCWVDFFGRPASCHKSLALFSLAQNAPMVFCYAKRRDRPMQFEVGVLGVYDPEKDGRRDVDELTQWYTSLLEEVIRTAPRQYWWLHRRWKERPGRASRRRPGRKVGPATTSSSTNDANSAYD